MCCLFGLIDYKNCFNAKQKDKIIKILSAECEARGVDAAGVAYVENEKIKVYKRPLPAHKINFKFKRNPQIIMGHTRMTTQGSEKLNYNNHPFYSTKNDFALAHNGVIYNDKDLRKKEKLPKTKIETDSFIAMQLIDKKNTLNFKSLKFMAEKVEGSFCFTILNNKNELFVVKGNNPVALYDFGGFYIYASTKEILNTALRNMRIKASYNEIKVSCGDIIKIKADGEIEKDSFDITNIIALEYQYLTGYRWNYESCVFDNKDKNKKVTGFEKEYYEDIVGFAENVGFSKEDIDYLLETGYDLFDIEDFLYDPQ